MVKKRTLAATRTGRRNLASTRIKLKNEILGCRDKVSPEVWLAMILPSRGLAFRDETVLGSSNLHNLFTLPLTPCRWRRRASLKRPLTGTWHVRTHGTVANTLRPSASTSISTLTLTSYSKPNLNANPNSRYEAQEEAREHRELAEKELRQKEREFDKICEHEQDRKKIVKKVRSWGVLYSTVRVR